MQQILSMIHSQTFMPHDADLTKFLLEFREDSTDFTLQSAAFKNLPEAKRHTLNSHYSAQSRQCFKNVVMQTQYKLVQSLFGIPDLNIFHFMSKYCQKTFNQLCKIYQSLLIRFENILMFKKLSRDKGRDASPSIAT